MNTQERAKARELAVVLVAGPDNTRRDEAYWAWWATQVREFHELVGPKEVIELIQKYDDARIVEAAVPWIDNSRFLVQATSFELAALREQYKAMNWVDRGGIIRKALGRIHGEEVCVCLTWVAISEEPVCFWRPVSTLVDYGIIHEGLKKMYPEVDQTSHLSFTDATGFALTAKIIKQLSDGRKGIEKLKNMKR